MGQPDGVRPLFVVSPQPTVVKSQPTGPNQWGQALQFVSYNKEGRAGQVGMARTLGMDEPTGPGVGGSRLQVGSHNPQTTSPFFCLGQSDAGPSPVRIQRRRACGTHGPLGIASTH